MSDFSPAGAAAFGAEDDGDYTDGEYTEEASYESDEERQMSSFGAKIGDGFVGDEMLSDSEGFEAAGDEYEYDDDEYVNSGRRARREPQYPTPDPDIALKRGRRQLARGRGSDGLMDARACGVPHGRKNRESIPPAPEAEVDTHSRRKHGKKGKKKEEEKAPAAAAQDSISPEMANSELMRAALMIQQAAQSLTGGSSFARQFLIESDAANDVVERPIVFSAAGSLASFAQQAKDGAIVLKPKGDMRKIFGAKSVNVLSMKIVAFDNTLPVSVAIDAPALPGEKMHNSVTPMNEPTMLVMPAKSRADSLNVDAYRSSKSSEYAAKFAKMYPGYNVDNMQEGILSDQTFVFSDGTKIAKAALVPVDHPVMSMLKEIAQQNGQKIDPKRLITELGKVAFDQHEVYKALNAQRELLLKSNEAVPIENVSLSMTRADVSQKAFDSRTSTAMSSLWVDPHEISTKKGEPRENEFNRNGLVRVTVMAKLRKIQDA